MEILVRIRTGSKVFIDYKYLIGICACLRQVDLSIDRCRWTNWNELRAFFEGKTDVEYFFTYFINVCRKLSLCSKYHELNNNLTRFSHILPAFSLSFLKRRTYMTIEQLETVYYLLEEFRYLLRYESPDSKQIELLRFRIANYYSNILLPKLKNKDIDKALKIDHYLQNESLETLSLNEIAAE